MLTKHWISEEESRAKLWDVATGKCVYTFDDSCAAVFDKAGTQLMMRTKEATTVWDLTKLCDYNWNLTLDQVLLMHLLYEIDILNSLILQRKQIAKSLCAVIKSSMEISPGLLTQELAGLSKKLDVFIAQEEHVLSLKEYPHLKSMYDSLPEWMRVAVASEVGTGKPEAKRLKTDR